MLLLLGQALVCNLLLVHHLSLGRALVAVILQIRLGCASPYRDGTLWLLMPLAAYSHPKASTRRLRLTLKEHLARALAVGLERFARSVAFLFFFDHVLSVFVIIAAMVMVYKDVLPALFLFVWMLQLRLSPRFNDTAC